MLRDENCNWNKESSIQTDFGLFVVINQQSRCFLVEISMGFCLFMLFIRYLEKNLSCSSGEKR